MSRTFIIDLLIVLKKVVADYTTAPKHLHPSLRHVTLFPIPTLLENFSIFFISWASSQNRQ